MIHLQLRRCVLSASRNIGQQRAMGFKVRVGAVEAPQTPIAERQRVQQTWGISGSETLEKLRVATPGITYVSVASPALFDEVAQAQGSNEQLVAVVRVSSDAQDLLGHVDVLTRGSNRLLIGFDPRPPRGWPVQEPVEASKHLLTEIFVREAELRSLGAFGGGSLVVAGSEHGNVLVTDRPYGKLKLASFRGSQVFVTQDQGFHTAASLSSLAEVDRFCCLLQRSLLGIAFEQQLQDAGDSQRLSCRRQSLQLQVWGQPRRDRVVSASLQSRTKTRVIVTTSLLPLQAAGASTQAM